MTRKSFAALGATAGASLALGLEGCAADRDVAANSSAVGSISSEVSESSETSSSVPESVAQSAEEASQGKEDVMAQDWTNGQNYIPFEERDGETSTVYFTRDLSTAGLRKLYERVNAGITGKVAIKLHTGEPNGPNIIPRPWVQELIEQDLPDATIVETNAYYEGGRYTTEQHRETIALNGWTFAPVDILDEEGTVDLPVAGGKWFDHMTMGGHLPNYDSLVVLTHFKGHTMGGFGGSNKNIGIGCADGRIGKKAIHTREGEGQWSIDMEELHERFSESSKATCDHFGEHITFVNVLRNMSVSCDCEGTAAEPVVTPNIGILASTDILAIDAASVDLVYALSEEDRHALVERIETRHGHRQLSYMRELGMGNWRYELVDTDNGDALIQPADAVEGVVPFTE